MNCNCCGEEIPNEALFCPSCGREVDRSVSSENRYSNCTDGNLLEMFKEKEQFSEERRAMLIEEMKRRNLFETVGQPRPDGAQTNEETSRQSINGIAPQNSVSDTRFCKACGKPMGKEQAVCLNCGVPAGKGKRFCYYCGNMLNEDAVVCVKCGCAVKNDSVKSSNAEVETATQKTKKSVGEKIFLIAGSVFIVCLFVAVIFIANGYANSENNKKQTNLGVITDSYWGSETLNLRFKFKNGYERDNGDTVNFYNDKLTSGSSTKMEFNSAKKDKNEYLRWMIDLTTTPLNEYKANSDAIDVASLDMMSGWLDTHKLLTQGTYTIANEKWTGYFCYNDSECVARFFKTTDRYVVTITFTDRKFTANQNGEDEMKEEFKKAINQFSKW